MPQKDRVKISFVSEFIPLFIWTNPLCGFTRGGKNKPDPADRTRQGGREGGRRPPANRRDKKEKKKKASEQCSSGAQEGVTNILCTGLCKIEFPVLVAA